MLGTFTQLGTRYPINTITTTITVGTESVAWIICSLGGAEENVKKMTGRCEHCYSDLRIARMERCDLEEVQICNGCERVYLGHPIEMLIQFPAKTPVRKQPARISEEMYVN